MYMQLDETDTPIAMFARPVANTLLALSAPVHPVLHLLAGVLRGEFMPPLAVRFPGQMVRTMSHTVSLVLGIGAVFQIFRSIVELVSIPVPDLGTWERWLSVKSKGHQAMHGDGAHSRLRVAHKYYPVTFAISAPYQHFSRYGKFPSAGSDDYSGGGPDTPRGGCFIPQGSRDQNPMFLRIHDAIVAGHLV